MRDVIWTAVICAAAVIWFSCNGPIVERKAAPGPGYQQAGECGPVQPGKGGDPVEPAVDSTAPRPQEIPEGTETVHLPEPTAPDNDGEEAESMVDVIVAFWHGVVAVLVGGGSVWLLLRRK